MQKPSRNTAVDTIRMASLIGICVVNVTFLGLPVEATMVPPVGIADQIVSFFVEALFQSKFFLMFSFLFGWGILVQDQSAARAGVPFAGRYVRRIIGLAALGCLHAVLVFTGDILLIYALLGLLIWPFRRLSVRTLMSIAYAMIPVAVICLTGLAVVMSDQTTPVVGPSLGGSFIEATHARLVDWPQTLSFLLLFQGPMAFGAFAMGLAAGKAQFFAQDSTGRAALARRVPWYLAFGIPLNLAYAASMSGMMPAECELLSLAGFVGIALAGPMLTAVYLHLLLVLNNRVALPTILVTAGQNSLTAYVLQGVFAGFVFGAYGLGLFDQISLAALLPLGLLIAVVAILVTSQIARQTGRGPLEAILRRVTYL
jgi:uncharacterized protein